jgi:hypothetical protein
MLAHTIQEEDLALFPVMPPMKLSGFHVARSDRGRAVKEFPHR